MVRLGDAPMVPELPEETRALIVSTATRVHALAGAITSSLKENTPVDLHGEFSLYEHAVLTTLSQESARFVFTRWPRRLPWQQNSVERRNSPEKCWSGPPFTKSRATPVDREFNIDSDYVVFQGIRALVTLASVALTLEYV